MMLFPLDPVPTVTPLDEQLRDAEIRLEEIQAEIDALESEQGQLETLVCKLTNAIKNDPEVQTRLKQQESEENELTRQRNMIRWRYGQFQSAIADWWTGKPHDKQDDRK